MTTSRDRRSTRDRALAGLLGLHGLNLLVVFPLGPQEARLWQPGIPGVAALAAAFPLAGVLGGLLGSRLPSLPTRIATLAWFAFLTTLPSLFSTGYDSLFAGRIISGFATGLGLVALHQLLAASTAKAETHRVASRIFTFGMPACILAATVWDWRATFALILGGQALVGVASRSDADSSAPTAPTASAPPLTPTPSRDVRRPVPSAPVVALVPLVPVSPDAACALLAAASVAFVTAAYLTILSGFLLFNAGHSEYHIPAGLLAGAILGLAVPSLLTRLRPHLGPAARFRSTLGASALSLVSLLFLQNPLPAAVAIGLIGVFLATSTARQIALGELVASRVVALDLRTLQSYNPVAHHLGAGLGACCAGVAIGVTPDGRLTGMPLLLAGGLGALGVSLAALHAGAVGVDKNHHSASPAARAAAANNPLRVATSWVRSVLTSNTRTPGSPT